MPHLFDACAAIRQPGFLDQWALRGIASGVRRIQANNKIGIPAVIKKPWSESGPSWAMNVAMSNACPAAAMTARWRPFVGQSVR
jgi:hypothetical protein